MNKTIIININGIVFHIEEDAYDILRAYMTDVKRHFAYSADSEEIVTDIENRIAEMFSERLAADQKQVIVENDVNYVKLRMGNVDEFNLLDDTEPETGRYKAGKKLFRDLDDRLIGGVCAGIGHYFGIEPRWVRLLAIISIFIAGSGLPVYIILWIVVPRAITRADKMAMKGEPINIQNFKKNFDEEVEGLRTGLNRAHHEARPLIDSITNFIGSLGMFMIKMGVGFIALLCIVAMFALFIGLFTLLGYWNTNQLNFFPFNIVNPMYKPILTYSAFVITLIPLLAISIFALKVLFTRFYIPRVVYFAMLIIWLAGLGFGVYNISKIGSEFNEEAKFSLTSPLKPSASYYLKINPAQFFTKEDSLQYNINPKDFRGRIIINSRRRELNLPRNVTLKIIRSESAKPELVQEFSSKGPNFETALATAQRSQHGFYQTDSLIVFDGSTHLKAGELWRDQKVTLILKLPVNTLLKIESTVNRYLEDYNLWECQPADGRSDFISEWKMTASGLKCHTDDSAKQERDSAIVR